MDSTKKTVKSLLRLEVIKKGQLATFFFGMFAIFIFIYGFNCVRFLPHIRFFCANVLLISIIRYFLFRRILTKGFATAREWRRCFSLVTLNGLCLGIIFALAAFELEVSGNEYVVLTAFVCGITATSIATIAYVTALFVPFQIILLMPQVLIICYYQILRSPSPDFAFFTLYLAFFAYQIRQFKSYHQDLKKFFSYQIELEKKNKELQESRDVIVDQTLKLVHTSRLAVLGEMSVGIAHEINNPLSVISTSAQMLSRMVQKGKISDEVVSSYYEKTNKAVNRISAIVGGLKLLSHQSDRVPKSEVWAEDILKETTPFCHEHFLSMGIILEVNSPNDVRLYCHPVQISQVIINLLKNAADAVAEDQVKDKWVKLDYKKEEDFFYFIISNGGERISQELANQIFEPFMTTKKHGTGLGLSISRAIMKEHGGEVYIDLTYQHSTFIMKLPLITQER